MSLARAILVESPLASGCSQVAGPSVGGALPSLCISLPSSAQIARGWRYAPFHAALPSLGHSVRIPFKLKLTSETPRRHSPPRSDVCPPEKAGTVKAPFVCLGKEGPHWSSADIQHPGLCPPVRREQGGFRSSPGCRAPPGVNPYCPEHGRSLPAVQLLRLRPKHTSWVSVAGSISHPCFVFLPP